MPRLEHDSKETQDCLGDALLSGFVAGLKASVASAGIYYLAMRHSQYFRKGFSVSARTAVVVMPVFYTSWLNIEHSMHDCMMKVNATGNDFVVIKDEHD